jgi:uncharacterized protein (DUF952 family)
MIPIYHITERIQYETTAKSGVYYPANYQSEGFIHCSTRLQVLDVANRYYANASDLVLLEIDPSTLFPNLVYENLEGNEEKFPHVYGKINLEAITRIFSFSNSSQGGYTFPENKDILNY